MTIKCAVCPTLMEAKRKSKKTCSTKCRQKYARMKTKLLLAQLPATKHLAAGKRAPKEYVIQKTWKGNDPSYLKVYSDQFGKGYNTIHWCTSFTLEQANSLLLQEKQNNPKWTVTVEKLSEIVNRNSGITVTELA
jgi:hypothetical protein